MPMPHRTQMQLIKRRLVGKDGTERIRELRAILTELPDYKNGPYADIRKWVNSQIVEGRTRAKVVARDSMEIRRQGAAQVALVGAPNVGKSSLLQALSDIQIRTGDFAFTTTRPVAAVSRVEGIPIQMIEIPGLIEGASEGRGGGRAFLSVLRHADAVVLCHDARVPPRTLLSIRRELAQVGISVPAVVAATRSDEASPDEIARLRRAVPDLDVITVSILDDASLVELRSAIWRLTGLVRIYLRKDGDGDGSPVSFRPPVTVVAVADGVHHDLGRSCSGARVWGPSARFPGQRVGRDHLLIDGDVVEIIP